MTPLVFEEAMHTYYQVGDVHETTLYGLEKTGFIDKTDDMKSKPASNEPLNFTGPTDRVYPNTTATCVIHDHLNKRHISVAKTNSNTTVVFNPWKEMPDLGTDEWHEMLAVETVIAAMNKVTLAAACDPHSMQAHISVENVKGVRDSKLRSSALIGILAAVVPWRFWVGFARNLVCNALLIWIGTAAISAQQPSKDASLDETMNWLKDSIAKTAGFSFSKTTTSKDARSGKTEVDNSKGQLIYQINRNDGYYPPLASCRASGNEYSREALPLYSIAQMKICVRSL